MVLTHQNAELIGPQLGGQQRILYAADAADLHAHSRITHGTMRAFASVSPCR